MQNLNYKVLNPHIPTSLNQFKTIYLPSTDFYK